jgi:signal transduction histidine kinase
MAVSAQILASIRAWPRAADLTALVRESLELCVRMFRADAATLVWEQREEPGGCVAVLDAAGFRFDETEEYEAERHAPAGRSVHGTMSAELFDGMLFVSGPGLEDPVASEVAELAALLIGIRMDELVHAHELRTDVAAAERMRVARDLHDGLLQSFTGTVLQLETIHSLLITDPLEAGRLLTRVQAAIMTDQRELRAYVEALRPRRKTEPSFDFAGRLRDLQQRFEDEWGVRVALESHQVDPHVGVVLGMETYRIVQEAVTNSARHGGAKRVDIRLRTDQGLLLVDVDDDGSGLGMRGRLTLAEIRESGIGPSTLAERVSSLNGEMTATSTDSGLHLRIALPLGWSGA